MRALYRSEPVFRAVLDRCEAAFQDFADATLLEPLCDREEGDAVYDDPAWSQPARYALECALVALWSSVGVRPGIVFGQGTGEIAAAQAAGMLTLEDGLRLASARGRLPGAMAQAADLEDTLARITMSPTTLTFVSGATGHTSRPGDALTGDDWKRQAVEPVDPGVGVTALAGLEVDAIVEIGPDAMLGPAMPSGWAHTAGTWRTGRCHRSPTFHG